MKLIVGLGNPGTHYESTRHNVGFMVVERLARELGTTSPVWERQTKHNALTARIGDILLVKPLTFMNSSGVAVRSLVGFYKLPSTDVWVIHDDIDLPLGKIRIRQSGASGGHRGVDSVIQQLKTDQFIRIRLGVGWGKQASGVTEDRKFHQNRVISFVLSRFRQNEAGDFKHLIKHGAQAVQIGLTQGLDKAMNRFN